MGTPRVQRVCQISGCDRSEIELTTEVDYFSIPLDFRQRFAGFDPVAVPVPRRARQIVIPGTPAYWRFDDHRDGALFPETASRSGTIPAMATISSR